MYRLYLELMFVGLILLSILLVNNIILYKQSIRERISMMLISGIAMSTFEIIWHSFLEHPVSGLNWLQYIAAYGYFLSFLIFAMLLNLYLIEHPGIHPKKRSIFWGYGLPFAAFFLLCLTPPFTRLLIYVDEHGVSENGVLLYTLFYYMLMFYLLSPSFVGVWFLTLGKKRRPAEVEITVSMFIFSIMVPVLYCLEIFLVGDILTSYQTLSLPVSLALVYLVSNVSTHNALEAQAGVEAVKTDLRIASEIQTDALPPVSPEFSEHPELNLRCSMCTAREVGGDFYD